MAPRRRSPLRAWPAAVLLVLLPAARAGRACADDGPAGLEPATQVLSSPDGKYRVRVPAAWTCTATEKPTAVLAVDCGVPGQSDAVRLAMFDLVGVELTPLGQAFTERDVQVKDSAADEVEVRTEPCVHLILRRQSGGVRWVSVFAYTRQHGHGIHLRLGAVQSAFDEVYPAFLSAVATAEANVEPFPAPPKDYPRLDAGHFRIWYQQGIDPKELDPIVKFLDGTEDAFEAYHGKIERPADERVSVVVHRNAGLAKSLSAEAAEAPQGALAVTAQRKVYLTLPAKAAGEARAEAREELVRLFLTERYPLTADWMWVGEPILAGAEERSGSKGPVVTEGWRNGFRGVVHDFDDLESIRESDWPAYCAHSVVYVLLLHYGPPKYRRAYAGFRSALAATGDRAKAEFEHLRSALDMEKMRRDAVDFLRDKVKVAKGV